MANKWTNEQQKAIDTHSGSILVSAAAGSGKTAVLVERILQKLLDKDNPVNIDQMVVVTYTKAAAGELKDRIRSAIERAAANVPDNDHLQKQKILIHHANISTIHAFCSMIIKNNFDKIDLDPASRIAQTGEINLLKNEAMEELLEEYYRREECDELNGEFVDLIEKFSDGKSDKEIEEVIFKVYDLAMSYPFPDKWLDEFERAYCCDSLEELENIFWMKDLREDYNNLVNYAKKTADRALKLTYEDDGPYMYREALEYYANVTNQLCECEDYASAYNILSNCSTAKLSNKKDKKVSPYLREQAKYLKKECADILSDITKKYYFQSPDRMQSDLNSMRGNIKMICSLVKDYRDVFSLKKLEKNVYDFSDLEHMALKILVDENGNPTDIAKEYADYFDEIMIDEYQDSNYVQEILLNSVSKRHKGIENVFMVGDAKQSIYRFRLARPEIFTGKYNSYAPYKAGGDNANEPDSTDRIRIDLSKNFRSRKQVLNSVNYIFEKIMKKSLGGIEYDNSAALYTGASYPENLHESDNDTEIILFSQRELSEIKCDEFEAEIIASRIKKFVSDTDPFLVTDKYTGELRPCRYNDIAILVRSNSSVAKECMKVFKKEDIPLVMPSKEGYFDAEEIDTILNLLRIIDNPMQDIPFVSVLKCPIVGLTENGLSKIKIEDSSACYYEAVKHFLDKGVPISGVIDNEAVFVYNKLKSFYDMFYEFRMKVNIMPLHEFIWFILDRTGYGDYICAMPNGEQRNANVEMLINKAVDFENTSYIGIFQFVKYIEQIRKYDVDEGQVSIINENDNTVKLMTIHKSKGLEFPVVIVAGLGKKFNKKDESSSFILHPELGIGINAVDLLSRHKRKTLIKQVISRKIHLETIAEEMRVLYVALTRAKEKLILTGGCSLVEKALSKAVMANMDNEIDIVSLSGADSFLDWILAAIKYHPDMREITGEMLGEKYSYYSNTNWDCSYNITIYNEEILLQDKLLGEIVEEETRLEFVEYLSLESEMNVDLEGVLNYQYPYNKNTQIPAKVSVSELKVFSVEERENAAKEQEETLLYPEFMNETKEKITGGEKGTLYHSIFKFLDYNRIDSAGEISNQIDEMFKNCLIDNNLKKYVNKKEFYAFAKSSVGRRMKAAFGENNLWREQPFVLSVGADLIDEHADNEETILVQGIIDAFFIEGDDIVLIDYKTDKVREESVLINRYREQMYYYREALSRLFEKNVKECIIYSVSLNKEIHL